MSTDDGYNGSSNYETWCVSLWLSNDEYNYGATRAMAIGTAEQFAPEDDRSGLARDLADMLKEYVEELPEVVAVTGGPASFVVDLLGAALNDVDWFELAENLLTEVADEVTT